MPRKSALAVATLGLALLAITGCSKKSQEASHLRKADAFFEADKYGSAEIEYINALRINSQNSQSLGRLGTIYLNEGRPQTAFSLLAEAVRLKPDNLEARKKMAELQIQFGKFKEAQDTLTFVLKQQPLDADAPLLLVSTARTRAAIEDIRSQLLALPGPAPQGAPVLVALGTIDFHEHKFAEAAAEFSRAQEIDPKSSDTKTALAYLYWSQNERPKAESAFADAAALSSPHSPKQLQYAEVEVGLGKVDAAKKLLEAITSKTPDYLPAWIMLAQIAGQQKDYDKGAADIAKVLAVDPQNPAALLENSRLQLARGDTQGAVTDLESASKDYPKAAGIEFELARAYLAAGSIDKAETSLKRGLSMAPNVMDAQVMLASVEVKKGDLPSSISILRKVVHDHPDNVQARILLGDALRAHGELDESVSVFRRLSETSPNDMRPQMMLGDIYLQQHQLDKARAAFENARVVNPDYLPALERLIDLDLGAKNFEGAQKLVTERIASHPADAVAQLILARICLVQRDAIGAETALKRSIELQPDGTRAYAMLARLYLSTHREREALLDLQAAVATHPKNTDAMMLMGAIQDEQSDYAGARATYEKILSINPKAVAALNNLAYDYSEHLNDLDKALATAETAQRLLPDDPYIADTLGWVLYRQHKYTRALALLTDSADRLPSEPEMQFHLGMIDYMLGREDASREALLRALGLSPQFTGRDEASSRLSVLSQDPAKGGEAEREAIEKAVSEQKDDPVALEHLATLYENEGSIDKAIEACQKALAVSPDDSEVLSRLAQLSLVQNEPAKAIEYGKKARELAPDDGNLAHVLGDAAYQSGDYPWSLSLLQEAAQKLPDDPDIHFDLGKSYYSEGNVADAEAQMKSALQAGPAFRRSAEAKQFVQMVDLSAVPDQALAAQSTIQQFLSAHPEDPTGLMASATLDEGLGNPDAAKKEYEKVLTKLPDFTPAKRSLAIIYSKSGEDDKTGFDLAVKARAAFPEDPSVAQALGIIDYRRGDYFNAQNLLQDALAKRGDDPELNFYLGMTDLSLKNSQAAKRALQKALDTKLGAPHSAEARQALEKLK